MKEIIKSVKTIDEINRSTFITYLEYVDDVNKAKEFLNNIKKEHPNATHHVSCYIIGSTGQYGHASDDGEPSGTAAMPMMDVFKKNDVTNFICIVVRYFGGVKLGAGGLVRAYSSSASHALKEAGIKDLIKYTTIEIKFNYDLVGLIDKLLKEYNIINKSFNNQVSYTLQIPLDISDDLINKLINATNNKIEIERD